MVPSLREDRAGLHTPNRPTSKCPLILLLLGGMGVGSTKNKATPPFIGRGCFMVIRGEGIYFFIILTPSLTMIPR